MPPEQRRFPGGNRQFVGKRSAAVPSGDLDIGFSGKHYCPQGARRRALKAMVQPGGQSMRHFAWRVDATVDELRGESTDESRGAVSLDFVEPFWPVGLPATPPWQPAGAPSTTFTITWLYDPEHQDGDWNENSRWDQGRLPNSTDDVGILDSHDFVRLENEAATVHSLTVAIGASLTMYASGLDIIAGADISNLIVAGSELNIEDGANATISSFFLGDQSRVEGGGTLTLTGDAGFANSVQFSTNAMLGPGRTVVQGTAELTTWHFYLDGGRALENQGTLTWSNSISNIYLGQNPFGASLGGATVQNDAGGTFIAQTDGTMAMYDVSGAVSMTNAGLFEKTGTGSVEFQLPFVNSGTIRVESGTLQFDSGGSSSAGGIEIDAGGTLLLTFTPFSLSAGTISGAGTLEIAADRLLLGSDNVAVAAVFAMNDSSIVEGTGTLTLSGAALFNNDTPHASELMTGSGTTILAGTTTIAAYDFCLDGDRVLENRGTLNWTSAGVIHLGENPFGPSDGGGTIKNDAGATFNIQADESIYGVGGTFGVVNTGLFEKTGGTGTSIVQAPFTNNGTVLVSSGTLEFDSAMSGNGSVTVNAGAAFVLNASFTSATNNVNIAGGSGHVSLTGGTGNDTFLFGGNFAASDFVNGTGGTDVLGLNGDYSLGLSLGSASVQNIDTLLLGAGHSYAITAQNSLVLAGQVLTVDGSALGSGNALTFNGAAESDGTFVFFGGAGSDALTGGKGGDVFNLAMGGNDLVAGGAGADSFNMGAALTASDQINGGMGPDTVVLNGDYSAGLTLGVATLIDIETLSLAAGHSYKLTANDGNVATGQVLAIDGSALGIADKLTFNGAAETDGRFVITGGAANDALTGGALNDVFNLAAGGFDSASGGQGNDTFNLGGAFNAGDRIDGGVGGDLVVLDGDYSDGLTLGTTTMVNVETLRLAAGHSYRLVLNDANVSAGLTLTIDGSALGANDSLTLRGINETDGHLNVVGGDGRDFLFGGAQDDTINGGGSADNIDCSQGGHDTALGGSGGNNDKFIFGALFDSLDRIDGGAGIKDIVTLAGDYSAGLAFNATTMVNVEQIVLDASFSYNFTTADATVAAGASLTFDGSRLGPLDTLTVNGAAESDGLLILKGGAGNDVLTGGNGGNTFTGGLGADLAVGGTGTDTFVYMHAAESTRAGYDTVAGFDFNADKFNVKPAIAAIDAAVNTGALSTANFDVDLAAAIGIGQLGKHHAVLFTPDSGSLAGEVFLIVDLNAKAGYQAGADLVIHLDGSANIAGIDTGDFL
jgi:Ca2+-binding RTX toxin-like protein